MKIFDRLGEGLTRYRTLILAGGSLLAMFLLYLTDPGNGAITAMFGISIVVSIIAVWFSHISRKALLDYPSADMETLFSKAKETASGAGMALIAIALIISALLGLFGRAANAAEVPNAEYLKYFTTEYVITTGGDPYSLLPGAPVRPKDALTLPRQAAAHLPTVLAQQTALWPTHSYPAMFGGLIQHESCISVTHSRCWNSKSQLKTSREEGAGLGQLTRAYKPNGTIRFDAMAEMKRKHPSLRELTWQNIYDRPELQIAAIVLKSKDDYSNFKDTYEPLSFTDAAYNAGVGGITKDRRACVMTSGCDPDLWFGHVESTCTRGRVALYAGRSACDINRHHVKDVYFQSVKYREFLPKK